MPIVAPLALPRVQILDNAGLSVPGALIYTYAAGTTTPLATYTNGLGVSTNTNPVVADSGGFADIWLLAGTAYKLNVKTSATPGPSVDVYPAVDNIVAGASLSSIVGYSANATQGNETLDPGEVGSEVLAATAADEIKEIRFRLQESALTSNWRTSLRTKTMHAPLVSSAPAVGGVLPAGVSSVAVGYWFVPNDYAFGDIIWNYFQRATVAGVVLSVRHQGFRFRDGTVVASLLDIDASGSLIDINTSHLVQRAFTNGTFAKGDFIRLDVIRTGGSDSNTGTLTIDGFFITYTGFA